jgi:hypothetical protein
MFEGISGALRARAARRKRKRKGSAPINRRGFEAVSERILLLQGRIASRQIARSAKLRDLAEAEFRVFSQWGEDGIIDWLAEHVACPNHSFIEFGVENFREANCRFLLMNRNWKGLVMDGGAANMEAVREEELYWRHDLEAKAAFITAENIDRLISESGFCGPLGLLSIDIDGNDYWVWEAISCVEPAIVVCEVNPVFGDMRAISVPYDPDFRRFDSHWSGLHFGASIAALKHLAQRKGYRFAGTTSTGINAFFVREALAAPVLELLGEVRAYPSRHRDSRDREGRLTNAAGRERFELIRECPVVDVLTGETLALGDISHPYSETWLAGMS